MCLANDPAFSGGDILRYSHPHVSLFPKQRNIELVGVQWLNMRFLIP